MTDRIAVPPRDERLTLRERKFRESANRFSVDAEARIATLEASLLALSDKLHSPGDIKISGRSTPETGWLLCNGAAVSRTTYAALFAAIGTTFGAGDGTTTFNLPPPGRFFLNKAASGTGSVLGQTGGSLDHVHAETKHTHTVKKHYHGMGTGSTLNITSSGGGGATGNDSPDHSHGQNVTANPNSGGSGTRSDYDYDATGLSVYPQGANTGGASARHTHTIPNHPHPKSAFAGSIGEVTGGVDGNADQATVANTASNTGSANPSYVVINAFIKT